MNELKIDASDRIAIIAPHPDDECIGCGGILIKYPTQCKVFVLTNGSQANKSVDPTVMSDTRKNEFQNEMKIAGVLEYQMLDFEDSLLLYENNCCERIDFENFTKVFLPRIEDAHTDHVAACFYAMKEIKKKCGKLRKLTVYQYEVMKPFDSPTSYFDISELMDMKMELIQCHQSQLKIFDYASWVYKLDSNHNIQYCPDNVKFSEVFREIDDYEKEYEYDKTFMELATFRNRTPKEKRILVSWLEKEIDGVKPCSKLKKMNIKNVAIYGYSTLGKLLYKELIQEKISVRYIFDKNVNENIEIPIYRPDCKHEDVDAVIVTVVSQTKSVLATLKGIGYSRLVTLEELL